MSTRDPADSTRGSRAASWVLLGAAIVVWAWSTFAHGVGTEIARDYFSWAQAPGNLHADGGLAGMDYAELSIAAAFLALVAAAVALTVRRVRELPPDERRERLLSWALWGCFVYLIWKTVIVYATELVHFAQYGLIAALLCAAIGRCRRPALAFLIAVALGALDEAWQHYGLAFWIEGNLRHGLDWSDLILNATGACGGALMMFTGLMSTGAGAGADAERSGRLIVRATAVLAVVLLPLLLLERSTLAALFGSYYYHPFWNELENGKPVHWMTPIDGIPLFVASVLFLGLLLSTGRALLTRGASLALLALIAISIQPPSRLRGMAVHEVVPTARAVRVETDSIVLDGRLDEPAWERAERIGPFVHHVTGQPWFPLADGGRVPLATTHARIVWDDKAVYFAFEAEDGDIWARDVPRDEPTLPGDEVVEVFIDPDGDEITYYEFEFSPLNVHYDLFNFIPEAPTDFNPSAMFVGLADWDAVGAESAVAIDGTLDTVETWDSASALDEDRGWTVEIAIPWRVFRTTTTPHNRSRVRLPPEPGHRWRMGLFRVERPRVSPIDGTPLSRRDAQSFAQLQAWSPMYKNSFHIPERYGVVEFVDEP